MSYVVGDIGTRERHPESPVFRYATEAAHWIITRNLNAQWWPIPETPDAKPARLEGTL